MRISYACWGQRLPNGDVTLFPRVAEAAERAGLHSIHLGEHVVIGRRLDRYPFGVFQDSSEAPWPDPIVCLAAAAAVTKRIRLSTGALLAPLRPPAILAKEVATLDAVSRGRVELVVGVGWQREEYVACEVPWSERYARLDANMRFCRRAWEGVESGFTMSSGEVLSARSLPRPVQDRLPVLLGLAPTPRNAARIAEYADGWCPMRLEPGALRAGIALITHQFHAAGRDPRTLEVRAPAKLVLTADGRIDVGATCDDAERLRDAGATVVAVGPAEGCRTVAEVADVLFALGDEAKRRG